ncbi:MAG: PDDEXK nuclease domain-containing protein [Sphingobacteriaceae bacterium]|nr:PDDEXK nuclease domain-containing protein [Sphingobacteriaceae bacterium]
MKEHLNTNDLSHSLDFYQQVSDLLKQARENVIRAINTTMVHTYFEIGRMIIEEEQNGSHRAEYGKQILKELSKKLSKDFGKGFSTDNLERMKKLYILYSNPISATPLRKFTLSWSHYLQLMRIKNENERNFYEIEALNNKWSLKELERQYNSNLYNRLALSKDKEGVKQLSEKGQIIEKAIDIIKDPYVLEFLNLPDSNAYSETELETALIDKLEHFLLELGKGFTFVGRQVRFTFDEEHFRVDLVFYNRLLKCFVLIDIKIGKLKHQDLGQMQMYVNYYDRFVKLDEENKTIGIILCKDKKDTMVEITLPENNEQIFASKYALILPSKSELQQIIENKD